MNDYVRALDVRYGGLTGAQKADWKLAAHNWPWLCYCLPDIYDFPEDGFYAGTGLQVYRTVNCSRLDIGQDVTDVVPLTATAFDNDTLSLFYAAGWYVVWGGRSSSPPYSYCADVRIWIGNHRPDYGPAVSKFVYAETLQIDYLVPCEIFAAPVGPPPPPSMLTIVFGVSVGDCGVGPFFGVRLPTT